LNTERFDTVVIGGGQAGLAMGYYLKEQGQDFAILDAGERIGDAWRERWDSLRLFTPAALNALPDMPFPFPSDYFPTKDETADYLEEYAREFDLPVRLGRHVDSLRREDNGYLAAAGEERYLAENIVVATGPYLTPRIPAFAGRLAPSITQVHSSAYRNPDQLPEGDVLVVGAGNWWEPATRAPRYPWSSPQPATHTSPDGTQATHSAAYTKRACPGIFSSGGSSGRGSSAASSSMASSGRRAGNSVALRALPSSGSAPGTSSMLASSACRGSRASWTADPNSPTGGRWR
jgi:glycine/D-amino acid oxidase-like deaminating enzyme